MFQEFDIIRGILTKKLLRRIFCNLIIELNIKNLSLYLPLSLAWEWFSSPSTQTFVLSSSSQIILVKPLVLSLMIHWFTLLCVPSWSLTGLWKNNQTSSLSSQHEVLLPGMLPALFNMQLILAISSFTCWKFSDDGSDQEWRLFWPSCYNKICFSLWYLDSWQSPSRRASFPATLLQASSPTCWLVTCRHFLDHWQYFWLRLLPLLYTNLYTATVPLVEAVAIHLSPLTVYFSGSHTQLRLWVIICLFFHFMTSGKGFASVWWWGFYPHLGWFSWNTAKRFPSWALKLCQPFVFFLIFALWLLGLPQKLCLGYVTSCAIRFVQFFSGSKSRM